MISKAASTATAARRASISGIPSASKREARKLSCGGRGGGGARAKKKAIRSSTARRPRNLTGGTADLGPQVREFARHPEVAEPQGVHQQYGKARRIVVNNSTRGREPKSLRILSIARAAWAPRRSAQRSRKGWMACTLPSRGPSNATMVVLELPSLKMSCTPG